ncbi:MAG: beta-aspartyl-peptidase [Tannerella sp.]|jgi:beta-aspartyl-dipeptidase (metallo-type)|nr:beta-aspartyl-peptidase [Tannerella sp.]
MLKLIKNVFVYAPEKLGMRDILLAGARIAEVRECIEPRGVGVEIFDGAGKTVTPGFIDQHVHITGGGGQDGYNSLAPPVAPGELIACGTTTVVGLLGTDGFVKELTELYAKTRALEMDGLSAYMLTGYYGLPTKTLMRCVADDLIFIDKVIGCKLALSDDRSSFPDEKEILRLINQVRLGGFTSGKGGILHIHVGNLPEGISVLIDIAKKYATLTTYISPTHVIRTGELFEQAITFAGLGGMIDISTGGTKFDAPHLCVLKALKAGVPVGRMTFSSDGHGGVRRIDPVTKISTYTPAPLDLNLKEMTLLVEEGNLPLEQALQLITTNPAKNMNLKDKGRIRTGYDADLCFLDERLNLTDVFAKGECVMKDGIILKKGKYDQ